MSLQYNVLLMRLFMALDLPEEIVRDLTAIVERPRSSAAINWSRPANLHVTTKFIGELPEARLGELKQALKTVPARPAFEVRVTHTWGDRTRPPHFTGIVPRLQRNLAPHVAETRPTPNGIAPHIKRHAGGNGNETKKRNDAD